MHDEKKSRVLRHPPAACRVKARRIPSPGWGERTLAGGKLASASAAPGSHIKEEGAPGGVTETVVVGIPLVLFLPPPIFIVDTDTMFLEKSAKFLLR